MCKWTILLAMLVVVLLGGCPMTTLPEPEPEPQPEPEPVRVLDGSWTITNPNMGDACVTIASNRIASWDAGCSGSFAIITNSHEAAISGDRVLWIFDSTIGGQTGDISIDVTWQADGTLVGWVTQSVLTFRETDPVVMTPGRRN